MKVINFIFPLLLLSKLYVAQLVDPVREAVVIDADKQGTTPFGTKINDTDTLTIGDRGPALLEDFYFREKITHFDHERIPERVVHARGVGAHGYFRPYKDWSNLTAAKFLRTPDTKTPVFVRFSTVLGSRGSADTVRDVRGFATKFYTEEGVFDLVANVIAPFFIQDSIKFPDLVHALKPEPDGEVPQASTAHCTSYDFFSQHTETIHTVMWVLSGRGLVKSFRQVEGFGIHTFRLVTEDGNTVFVKFIWKPLQGLSNLVWDEAQKIAGKDIDYHRNDLYNAIERGYYPEYELGVQIIPIEDEYKFDFDLLDSTKIIPESIIPFQPLGKMTLNRMVDNFFSETEQVTYHVGHVVRGITFTDDPLLQGRLFSYTDTQINRMNTVNFRQIPINAPHNPVHNNYRDGFAQHKVFKGKVSYYPNKMQNNTPTVVSAEEGGYIEYPEKIDGHKQRGKGGKFANHFSQAQLFYNSLTTAEQQQVIDAARFELGKCGSKMVRENMVQVFNKVDNNMAVRIASGIGVDPPEDLYPNKKKTTINLSIENYPRPNTIRGTNIAILTGPGIDTEQAINMCNLLQDRGAWVDFIGLKMGEQDGLTISQTYITAASVLYDAVYVPSGTKEAFDTLIGDISSFPYDEPAVFILDTYRHGKPIAVSGRGAELLKAARLPSSVFDKELFEQRRFGVIFNDNLPALSQYFEEAILKQRFWIRLPIDPEAVLSPTIALA
ncbi:catalase-like domain-containing protein [Pilaira anomala]|nr:catalase-like domain-containing protein [Pilaira anomala]